MPSAAGEDTAADVAATAAAAAAIVGLAPLIGAAAPAPCLPRVSSSLARCRRFAADT